MPKLPSAQRIPLMDALLDAFPDQDALARMIFRHLDAGIAAFGGKYAEPDVVVMNLIIKAEASNAVNRLIAAARASEPNDQLVRALSETLAPTKASTREFEVLIDGRNPSVDATVFLSRLSALEGLVARVECAASTQPMVLGNAFPVTKDRVPTNLCVLDGFAERGIKLDRGSARSDDALMLGRIEILGTSRRTRSRFTYGNESVRSAGESVQCRRSRSSRCSGLPHPLVPSRSAQRPLPPDLHRALINDLTRTYDLTLSRVDARGENIPELLSHA